MKTTLPIFLLCAVSSCAGFLVYANLQKFDVEPRPKRPVYASKAQANPASSTYPNSPDASSQSMPPENATAEAAKPSALGVVRMPKPSSQSDSRGTSPEGTASSGQISSSYATPLSRPADENLTDATAAATPVMLVPPGAVVPAAMIEAQETNSWNGGKPMTAQQQRMNQEISENFLQEVGQNPDSGQTWQKAQQRSDEWYRAMFGNSQYLRQNVNAATSTLENSKVR